MRNTSHPQGKSSMKHRYLVTKYSCVKDLCAVLTPARHVLRIHSSLGAYFSLKFPLMNNTWFLPLCESLSTRMSWLGRRFLHFIPQVSSMIGKGILCKWLLVFFKTFYFEILSSVVEWKNEWLYFEWRMNK